MDEKLMIMVFNFNTLVPHLYQHAVISTFTYVNKKN